MSMNHEAAEYKAKVQERLGEKFGILAGDMERVRAAGTIDAALKVGKLAPEFTLPDSFGKPVSVSALLVRGPVVISFYRGEWCPFCNIEMRALQQALPTMEQLGATLIAISPEKPDHGIVAAEKNMLTFPVLRAVSMGQRNTQLRPTFIENKILKALARVRSAGTLPWLGLATSAKQIDSSG